MASGVILGPRGPIDEAGHYCRGACGGTNRGMDESPARFGRKPDGTTTIWCPCCFTELRPANAIERFVSQPRPLNLIPEVDGTHRRVVDDLCGYEVVWLQRIEEAKT